MPAFEFEVTHRIELTCSITVNAATQEAAQAKLDAKIETLADKIDVKYPTAWELTSQETEYEAI